MFRRVTLNLRSFSVLSSLRVAPRVFPTTGFRTIPTTEKLDEENWTWYKPETFYPVAIGEILRSRYQVLYKLGFGATSTVWMCRDLDHDTYVCLKSFRKNHLAIAREIKAYECMSEPVDKDSSDKVVKYYGVRQILDHFQLRSGAFDYHFLVQEPLGISMQALLNVSGRLPISVVYGFADAFLRTLVFVHKAQVAHADIHPGNIFCRITDKTVLKELEEDEMVNPSARKITEGPPIFATKNINYGGSLRRWFGENCDLVLCDFGEARTGKNYYCETIQPRPHRAPEVLMQIGWLLNADIWSFGCMLWQFATGDVLFPCVRDGHELEGRDADAFQLATMAALLGPPSPRMLSFTTGKDPDSPMYFHDDGSPKCVVPQETLESRLASCLKRWGDHPPMTPEQGVEFIAFIRRVLVWDILDRPSASALLNDPWIRNDPLEVLQTV